MEKKVLDSTAGARSGADDASLEVGNVTFSAEYANENPSGPNNQLHRTFSARHIQMIGLAGSIGSGLFIGTGKVSYATPFLSLQVLFTERKPAC
jgi:amino acid permease